ncbi:MAG TPA: ABC transporter substrate-binding protein [Alphaproteobacteria bacterium]|nr:ABC transporter substrate-binding protein [Alphaproteobacteria bacterium]
MTASRRMIGRRRLLKGLAAGATLAATGAAWRPARAQQALKIGLLLPRSGYLAQAGQACQRGADIAPAILADMGMPIELSSVDFESNVDLARTQAEKLIDNGAQVLVGAFESGATLSIAQVAEQRGVPFVINIAAAPQITEQGYKTVFRNFPTSANLITHGLTLTKDLFKATGHTPKTAAFIHANDTFGQANRAAIDKLFPTLDMPFKLIDEIAYDPKAQDLSVEVAKLRADKPDLVIVTTRAADAIKLVREMVKQHVEPMGIVSPGSPGMYDEEFFKSLGKYADYCISNVPWYNSKSKLAAPIEAAYKKAFASKGQNLAYDALNVGFTFEALLIAADAHKRAGSADKAALLDALRKTHIAEHLMIGGPIAFDAKGQNQNVASACLENLAGVPTVVLPADVAVKPPVFPMPGWQKRA